MLLFSDYFSRGLALANPSSVVTENLHGSSCDAMRIAPPYQVLTSPNLLHNKVKNNSLNA